MIDPRTLPDPLPIVPLAAAPTTKKDEAVGETREEAVLFATSSKQKRSINQDRQDPSFSL